MAALGHAKIYFRLKVNVSPWPGTATAKPTPSPPQPTTPINPSARLLGSAILFRTNKTNVEDSGATWKDDDKLKEAMTKLVQQGLQRIEALDFLKRDFPDYPWSMRTLDRRLRHFDVFIMTGVLKSKT